MIRLPLLACLGLACSPAALAQAQEAPPPSQDEEEIVVEARQTPFGTIPGDLTPVTTVSSADIRASGAATVADALASIAPQTGAAGGRGGGRPAILVNGRRIASFQEVRDLPAEAIARIEVFDEQAGLQYGFAPDQRVVNIVLRPRYQANTAEIGFAQGAEGERSQGRLEANHLTIRAAARTAVGATYEASEDLSEAERGAVSPIRRTLLPEENNLRLFGSLAQAMTERIGLSLSLRAESAAQTQRLNPDAVRDRLSQSLGGALTLDGQASGWQWTVTASADLTATDSDTVGAVQAAASSDAATLDLTANASGPVFSLPAGSARLSARLTTAAEQLDAAADRGGALRRAHLSRESILGRMGLTLPLTSRRREALPALGDLALNASLSAADINDLNDMLEGFGYGLSWSPTQTLRLSLQAEITETAPSLRQRGDPPELTPNARFFDPATGQTAFISLISGGNPALEAETRDDLTVNLAWSPASVEGLTLTASWARNEADNIAAPLPATLPETEAAFPGRFQRNSEGALVAVDARPVALASRETAFARWGISYSTGFGAPIEPSPGAPPWGQGLPPWGTGAPPWGSGPPPWGSGPPPGVGGGGRRPQLRPGRFSLSLSYRERLTDSLVLVSGAAPIDLVARGGLDAAGEPAGLLEFQSWVSYRGVSLRLGGVWSAAYETPGGAGVGPLRFSERLAANARLSVALDRQPFLIERWPGLRGVRAQLAVDNLTDSAVDVRDSLGQTPLAYQEAYQNPSGRVVSLSLRRQF
ncbi:MAG: TonB-dependent receptor [Alphaproteobacteria bacterium]|nr:TonB-dependent receptor [Alphaproteobacteria bacterium]